MSDSNNITIDIIKKIFSLPNDNFDQINIADINKFMLNNCTIAALLIIKNEEDNIQMCLNSIENVFDEIVIIDTGSTDKTLKLIKNFDLKLYHYNWDDNFANARNFAVSKCNSDYIFFIDADEELDASFNYTRMHYIFNIINASQYLSSKIFSPIIVEKKNQDVYKYVERIFKKNSHYRYFGNVHEEIRLNNIPQEPVSIAILIHHNGYEVEIINKKQKINRNLKLLRLCQKVEPFNLRWYYFYLRDGINHISQEELQCTQSKILSIFNNTPTNSNFKYYAQSLIVLAEYFLNQQNMKDFDKIFKKIKLLNYKSEKIDLLMCIRKFLNLQRELSISLNSVLQLRKNTFKIENDLSSKDNDLLDILLTLLYLENLNIKKGIKLLNDLEISNKELLPLLDRYKKIINE